MCAAGMTAFSTRGIQHSICVSAQVGGSKVNIAFAEVSIGTVRNREEKRPLH